MTKALRERGLDLLVLSGDREAAVAPVARQLGIRQWVADLTPAEKIAAIDLMKLQGRRILMVGDGLNDAPALAAAHVSLSPITAAHLTQAQADAVFLGERLAPVLNAFVIARRARALMRQNLVLAVVYNTLAVPIAIAGYVTPLIAALAMSGSSIIVTLNALRARLTMTVEPAASGPARCLRKRTAHSQRRSLLLPLHHTTRQSLIQRRSIVARRRFQLVNVLVFLVPLALLLGLIGLVAFLWSLKSGQYEDLDGASFRVLTDDDLKG